MPTRIVLDLDSTDDPTHGAQEGSAYHGYFRQHMYHPLLVFDGETGQIITAALGPARPTLGSGRWPSCAGWCSGYGRVGGESPSNCALMPASPSLRFLRLLRAEQIAYTIGLCRNARLEALAVPPVATALADSVRANGAKVRLLDETVYQADPAASGESSSRPRCWPRASTPALWSPLGRTSRKPSTPGTPIAARRRTGSRI